MSTGGKDFVVSVPANLGADEVSEILENIQQQSDPQVQIVLDCASLTRVDSTRVAALCQLFHGCARLPRVARLESITPTLDRVLKVMDLHDLLVHGECTIAAAPSPGAPLASVSGARHFHASFVPTMASVDEARSRFRAFVESFASSEVDACELEIVFYEIATNVLFHGAMKPNEAAVCDAAVADDVVRIVFSYPGVMFDPTKHQSGYHPADFVNSGRTRGLGLTMVRRMTNHMSYRRDNETLNVLSIDKRLRYDDRTRPVRRRDLGSEAPVITAPKNLDNESAHAMMKSLQRVLSSGHRSVIVDLSGVERISSAGAGAILGYVSQFRQNGGDIVLCNASASVRHVLDVLDLTDYLTLRPDLASAQEICRSFNGKSASVR